MRNLEDHGHPQVLRVLVANKSDLVARRVVSREDGEQLAARHNMNYFEVSAKEGTGVETVFVAISKQASENGGAKPPRLSKGQEKVGNKCC